MNAFKFSCPNCGQHIQTEASQIGRTTACPSCQATITIPPPPVEPAETSPAATATPAKPVSQSATATLKDPEEIPADQAPMASQPTLPSQTQAPAPDASPAPKPASVESETATAASDAAPPTQIAVLTPEIKLEIIEAAREQIADESRWMPEKLSGGVFSYAGKMVDDQLADVPATSLEATHFSLFGAVLREFDRRNVKPIATGRKEFLDDEIPDAVQQVLGDTPGGESVDQTGRPPLSHAQTLDVLEVLQKRFEREVKTTKSAFSTRKLSNLRVEDLVGKLEVEAPIKAEEVATALYHELEEIKERLARVEKALRKSRPSSSGEAGSTR